MNFARNSLNRYSRENGNPVPDQVEDKYFQLVIDSRFCGNDRKRAFIKRSQVQRFTEIWKDAGYNKKERNLEKKLDIRCWYN